MNRLEQDKEKEPPRSGVGDYFVVATEQSTWRVSTAMAKAIDEVLDAEPKVRWVKFVDLAGSRVRLRVSEIEYVTQCTAEQRAADRRFDQAIKREYKADRSWDE